MNKKKDQNYILVIIFAHLHTADALKVNIHDKSMYISHISVMDCFLRVFAMFLILENLV